MVSRFSYGILAASEILWDVDHGRHLGVPDRRDGGGQPGDLGPHGCFEVVFEYLGVNSYTSGEFEVIEYLVHDIGWVGVPAGRPQQYLLVVEEQKP